ncbi:MAG: MBOAT family protein [Deltaproteobacteria bacterium]|nr:MBOAT family protein [Deltaproteobacteria bacterium]
MLFNSYPFIFAFLPITLLGFFLIGGRLRQRSAIAWLVGASLFFYGWWDPTYLWVITTTMIFNYGAALALRSQRWHPTYKKAFLALCITVNLLRLGYFKYANFFVANVNQLGGTNFHLDPIVLPLGISFFTFVEIAYLVDAYRNEVGDYNFLDYCLFITFFPHLLAGPIVHHKEMLPQFSNPRIYRFHAKSLAVGLTTFTLGLFKKAVLADSVAVYANHVFHAAAIGVQLTFLEAWGGALAYTLQLYFDFSGYSDMAIGLGLMFGIKWPLNFYSPYKSVNIIEFWRRWHMTLSRFLRDYLYFSLGGNRKGAARRHVNLLITMLLGGLWHGAGWTFVIWGGLHGTYLVINHAWQAVRRHLGLTQSYWWTHELARGLTFLAVVVGWVFFRAADVPTALSVLKAMAGHNGLLLFTPLSRVPPHSVDASLLHREATVTSLLSPFVFGDPLPGIAWIVGLLLVVRFLPNTHEFMRRFKPTCNDYQDPIIITPEWLRWQPTRAWALMVAVMLVLAVFRLADNSEFLYFQF